MEHNIFSFSQPSTHGTHFRNVSDEFLWWAASIREYNLFFTLNTTGRKLHLQLIMSLCCNSPRNRYGGVAARQGLFRHRNTAVHRQIFASASYCRGTVWLLWPVRRRHAPSTHCWIPIAEKTVDTLSPWWMRSTDRCKSAFVFTPIQEPIPIWPE